MTRRHDKKRKDGRVMSHGLQINLKNIRLSKFNEENYSNYSISSLKNYLFSIDYSHWLILRCEATNQDGMEQWLIIPSVLKFHFFFFLFEDDNFTESMNGENYLRLNTI